jgi:hypothetical protein
MMTAPNERDEFERTRMVAEVDRARGLWEQPPTFARRELCLTNLTYYFDVHILDEQSDSMSTLRRARKEGWIRLQKTDTLDTELSKAAPDQRADLTELSAGYAEAYGPLVFNHSRLGTAVFASDEDEIRLQTVLAITKPGVSNRRAVGPNDMRDAMHVSTAIRYAGSGFITRDKNLLRHSVELSSAFSGFIVCAPEDALLKVESEIRLCRRRREVRGSDWWLPEWPQSS